MAANADAGTNTSIAAETVAPIEHERQRLHEQRREDDRRVLEPGGVRSERQPHTDHEGDEHAGSSPGGGGCNRPRHHQQYPASVTEKPG